MSDHIESGKILVKEAFSWWYRVPVYQRPYVWGTDQVNDLLEDVAHASSTKSNAEYFLGSIVLQTRKITDNDGTEYKENDLLDGQQRLTTCLMLHAVARDLSADNKLKEICRKTVFQEENPFDGIPERLRIIFDIRQEVRDFVTTFLKTDDGTNDEKSLQHLSAQSTDISVRNMAAAVLEIRRFLTEGDAPKLETLFQFLRNKVLLIYVASEELEDAFRLFTVLNDRGMKLRNSDILKTMNLSALKDTGGSEQELRAAAQLWEEIEGELGEDFDVFLSHLRTVLVKEKARLGLLQEFDENVYDRRQFNRDSKQYTKLPPLLARGRPTFDFVRRYRQHYQALLSGNNYDIEGNWEFDNLVSLLNDAGLADFWVHPFCSIENSLAKNELLSFSGSWKTSSLVIGSRAKRRPDA